MMTSSNLVLTLVFAGLACGVRRTVKSDATLARFGTNFSTSLGPRASLTNVSIASSGMPSFGSGRGKLPQVEVVKFGVQNPCTFRVTRHRKKAKVVSVTLWKQSVGYLHAFEFAAIHWPEFLWRTYGEDWNLRIYIDGSIKTRLASKEVQLKGKPVEIQNRTTPDLFDILKRAASKYENVELWETECVTLNMAKWRKMEKKKSDKKEAPWQKPVNEHPMSTDDLVYFMSMIRFHPFFDDTVTWAVEKNFELMTSHHEAELVREWVQSGKPYFFTARHRTYKGNYDMDMTRWRAEVENADVSKALEPMWTMDADTSADYFPHGRERPREKSGVYRDKIKNRNMLLACLGGVRGRTLNPLLWDVMIEAAKLSQPRYGLYGVDEIALNLALKYLPLGLSTARLSGALPEVGSEKIFFEAVFGDWAKLLPRETWVTGLLPPPISPANTFAVPRSWELSRFLYDLALLQPYAGVSIHEQGNCRTLGLPCTVPQGRWLGASLGSDVTWRRIFEDMMKEWERLRGEEICPLVCKSGFFCAALGKKLKQIPFDLGKLSHGMFLEGIADALYDVEYEEDELVYENERCRPLQAWLYQRLLVATQPEPSECPLLCFYKQLIWRASAEIVGAVRPPIPWTNSILPNAFKLDVLNLYKCAEKAGHVLSPKIWTHAFLQVILVGHLHEPGGVTKTKNGLLERNMMKHIFEDKSWVSEVTPILMRRKCPVCSTAAFPYEHSDLLSNGIASCFVLRD